MIELKEAQKRAVDRTRSIRGPVWLRGETGTGKTITSIRTCLEDLEQMGVAGRVLVVVPERMLMEKWCDEIRLMGAEPFMLGGPKETTALLEAAAEIWPRWVVVSYNALSFTAGRAVKAMTGCFSHIIFDESQKAKSPGSKRVRRWKRFVKNNFVKLHAALKAGDRLGDWDHCRTLMLSATPLIHNAIDLITQYGVAAIQDELAPVVEYQKRAITPEIVVDVPVGWDAEAIESGRVAEVLGRRRTELLQKDVFPPELPPMIEERWGMDLGSAEDLHAELVAQAVRDDDSDDLVEQWGDVFWRALAGENGPDFWEALDILAGSLRHERNLKCRARTMPMMLWGLFLRAEGLRMAPAVADRLAELERPAVVFANHKEPLYRIRDRLEGRVRTGLYTGAQSPAQARAAKEALRVGGIDILLATYQKGGVGVEFTPTPVVVLAQRSPSPADMEQAKARIYRLNSVGQTWSHTCLGLLEGGITRLEQSLSSIIAKKQEEAKVAGLEGTLGR